MQERKERTARAQAGLGTPAPPDSTIRTPRAPSPFVSQPQNPPEPETVQLGALYHYCDLTAFLSILKSGRLRLSDALTLNDSEEISWGVRRFFEGLKRNSRLKIAEDLLSAIQELRSRFDECSPCVSCLSSQSDSISQWRGYAADGTGAAVGLRFQGVRRDVEGLELYEIGSGILLGPVIYDQAAQEAVVDRMIYDLEELSKRDGFGGRSPQEIATMIAPVLHGVLSAFQKNAVFADESEWRCVKPSAPVGMADPTETAGHVVRRAEPRLLGPLFRSRGARLIRYYVLELPPTSVCEVRLGPRCEARATTIEQLLTACGLDPASIPIIRSEASYRG